MECLEVGVEVEEDLVLEDVEDVEEDGQRGVLAGLQHGDCDLGEVRLARDHAGRGRHDVLGAQLLGAPEPGGVGLQRAQPLHLEVEVEQVHRQVVAQVLGEAGAQGEVLGARGGGGVEEGAEPCDVGPHRVHGRRVLPQRRGAQLQRVVGGLDQRLKLRNQLGIKHQRDIMIIILIIIRNSG